MTDKATARGAPAGAEVRIFYDSRARLQTGDALKTTTGRVYVIVGARRQLTGRHVGRWHLRCVVVGNEPPPAGARVWPLFWYRRDRKS